MLTTIQELEREIDQFHKNIKDSNELMKILMSVASLTKTQTESFEVRTKALHEELSKLPPELSDLFQKKIEGFIKEIHQEHQAYQSAVTSLMDRYSEKVTAAEGAIGIAKTANKVRKEPLRVILNGLGKDAAQVISRINGFTYVKTDFDFFTGKVNVLEEIAYSDGERSKVRCYGANDVREGVAIMHLEGVDVSITGNSTNPTRFQHPVAGTYKKECIEIGKKYFSVASGGGTGRTLHPDNMAAGPASYGMTDTMGRMHSDAQFAGSSSVPAHVEMMGLIGMGNNPMVGASVAVAVAVEEAMK